jgi:hypothetical protein
MVQKLEIAVINGNETKHVQKLVNESLGDFINFTRFQILMQKSILF